MKRSIIAFSVAAVIAPSVGAVNYRGDVNRDSKVDMHDMAALTLAVNGGNADVKVFDLNADGVVDDRDLETLANVILTQSLVEDTGVNVGIGDWENGGEWGGTVGKPRKESARRAETPAVTLYGRNGYDYKAGSTSTGIHLGSNGPVSGLLLDFGVPSWEDFEMDESSVTLNGEWVADHRLYGKMVRITERDSPVVRYRVMVFSPTLEPLILSDAPLINFRYSKDGRDRRDMPFDHCQAVLPASGEVIDVPYCSTELWWGGYVPVRDLVLSDTSVNAAPGERVKISLNWIPQDVSCREYEIKISNEDAVTIENGWGQDWDLDWNDYYDVLAGNKLVLKVHSTERADVTLHTTDGSDITRTLTVNDGTGVETPGVEDPDTAYPVYTLHGISLGILGHDALLSLPAGVYIRNGRKLQIP